MRDKVLIRNKKIWLRSIYKLLENANRYNNVKQPKFRDKVVFIAKLPSWYGRIGMILFTMPGNPPLSCMHACIGNTRSVKTTTANVAEEKFKDIPTK